MNVAPSLMWAMSPSCLLSSLPSWLLVKPPAKLQFLNTQQERRKVCIFPVECSNTAGAAAKGRFPAPTTSYVCTCYNFSLFVWGRVRNEHPSCLLLRDNFFSVSSIPYSLYFCPDFRYEADRIGMSFSLSPIPDPSKLLRKFDLLSLSLSLSVSDIVVTVEARGLLVEGQFASLLGCCKRPLFSPRKWRPKSLALVWGGGKSLDLLMWASLLSQRLTREWNGREWDGKNGRKWNGWSLRTHTHKVAQDIDTVN